MKTIDSKKDIAFSIKEIEDLLEKKDCKISIGKSNESVYSGHFQKSSKKGFEVIIDKLVTLGESDNDLENISIDFNDLKIKCDKVFITNSTLENTVAIFSNFSSDLYDKNIKSFYRLIIPSRKKLDFIFTVENVICEIINHPTNYRTRDCIRIRLSNSIFDCYQYFNKSNQKNYIVIDSPSCQKLSQFSEKCHSILISFGFITGNFIQSEGFFFQYKDDSLKEHDGFFYSIFRDSIKSSYHPVCTNAYAYTHDKIVHERINPTLREVSLTEFTKLCRLLLRDYHFKTAVLLIIEASNQSLISGPNNLAVALETLANIIYKENEDSLAPIKDKKTAKALRNELQYSLKKYNDKIDKEGFSIISNKINNLNQRTNREKLLIPFNLLKIGLNQKDIECIEQRNSFLHGRNPMIDGLEPKNVNEKDRLNYYLFLRLYTLVSAVVLKFIGFDNKIVNFPKIFEKSTDVKLEEDYYRQI